MDTTRKTDSGLEQKLHLFETPLKEEEVKVTIRPVEDENAIFEDHARLYAGHIPRAEWRELALALNASNPNIDPRNLELLTTTSYALQAVRDNVPTGVIPVSVDGLVLTGDNKFSYGIRGGLVKKGYVDLSPAGALDKELYTSFYEELQDETGIGKTSINKPVLIGHQTDPNFIKGIHFVFFANTNYTSPELIEMHRKAYEIYRRAKESSRETDPVKVELLARKTLKDSGLPNVDAWEHEDLVFVENDPNQIKRIIDSGKVTHKGVEYPVMDFGVGALVLYNMLLNKSRE